MSHTVCVDDEVNFKVALVVKDANNLQKLSKRFTACFDSESC